MSDQTPRMTSAPGQDQQATLPPAQPSAGPDATVARSATDSAATLAPDATRAEAGGDARAPAGYAIEKELGRGGMGVVYLARSLALQRPCALKMILSGAHTGSAEVERFRTEAQAIARLQHPGIVQVFEIGEHDGRPFMALEFCPGGSLDGQLAKNPLAPRAAAKLVQALAEALHAAHTAKVLHRDLKPANVLLTEKGEPKVTDFGLAKKLDEQGATRTGSVMGTPSYMPPEQAEGKKDVGPAADVYSLGAILYECLVGRPPFKAATALDTILQLLAEEPVPVRQLNAQAPADLETICLKCLHKEPRKRYATAQELADDLGRFLGGEPIRARPVSRSERVVKWVRRRPMVAGLLSAVILVTVVGMAAFAWAFGQAVDVRDDAIAKEQETDKARKRADEALRENEKARKNLELEQGKTKDALAKESEARLEAERRREHAEALALRVQLERYFAKAEDRPELLLVGSATLLPKAARLKDQSVSQLLRLQVGAWSGGAARLNGIYALHENLYELGSQGLHHYYAMASSADRRTVLTVSADNTARLREMETGKSMGRPLQLQGVVITLALSADGKTALTGNRDHTAQLWDIATAKPIGPPLQHQDAVKAVALSADGKIALTGSDDKTARLWDRATGKPIGPPLQHQDQVCAVALSADGKTALTGSFDKTARLWDGATGKPIGPPLQHETPVQAVALGGDGKTALTGSMNGAWLWEMATGKPIGRPMQHQGRQAWAVALSADGKTALTASDDGTARLWETATGEQIGPPLRHREAVIHVALSADGRTALTASRGDLVRLWKTKTAEPIGPALQLQGGFVAVALSADGKTALTGSELGTRLWDTATGKPIGPPLQHKGMVFTVALSADGKTALTGSDDHTARLWDTANGRPIGPPLQHKDAVFTVALSGDGKTALTGSLDGTSRFWDPATGKPIGPPLQVMAVALSADAKMALAASADNAVRLWDTATGKPIGPALQLQGGFVAAALSADGKIALTGSLDKTARLWETATGRPIGPPLQHQEKVWTVALSTDGKAALTGSEDGTARLWETATGKQIGPPLQHQDKVTGVALSADGKMALAVAGKTSRYWRVPQPIRGNPERIMLWAQVITGLEVDELTAVRFLDAATWQQRRKRLQELGGPLAN